MSAVQRCVGAGAGLLLVAIIAACSAGDGPIGVPAIGTRESPGASTDEPHGRTPAGNSSSPTPVPTSTTRPGSDMGGDPTNLASTCTGSFDCEGAHITLATSGGKCMFTVNDQPVIMNPDKTLVLPTGESAGTWTGDATGFTVTGGPTNRMTVCKSEAPDSGK